MSYGVILCFVSVLGYTEVSCGNFWAIHTETKLYSMYTEMEYYMYTTQLHDAFQMKINKKIIKMNKPRYFDVSFR